MVILQCHVQFLGSSPRRGGIGLRSRPRGKVQAIDCMLPDMRRDEWSGQGVREEKVKTEKRETSVSQSVVGNGPIRQLQARKRKTQRPVVESGGRTGKVEVMPCAVRVYDDTPSAK